MCGGKDEDALFYLPELRILLVHGAMSSSKDQQVNEDKRKRYDRPTASRHVLVLDWDNHARGCNQTCFAKCRSLNVTEPQLQTEAYQNLAALQICAVAVVHRSVFTVSSGSLESR